MKDLIFGFKFQRCVNEVIVELLDFFNPYYFYNDLNVFVNENLMLINKFLRI